MYFQLLFNLFILVLVVQLSARYFYIVFESLWVYVCFTIVTYRFLVSQRCNYLRVIIYSGLGQDWSLGVIIYLKVSSVVV